MAHGYTTYNPGGKVVLSNGMREEFDLAVAGGVFVLPIGITGKISAKLWGEVITPYDETKYEHGKKNTPLLPELGTEGTDLGRAHDVILRLLPLI
jgi:hypothetical protein